MLSLCFQVQYNLLTPPATGGSAGQEGGRRGTAPLYYGFKEVEENWTKHCSAGRSKSRPVRLYLIPVDVTVSSPGAGPNAHWPLSRLDSTLQPRFYCVLSPEASEDDRSRLDSKVSSSYSQTTNALFIINGLFPRAWKVHKET